jgi:hypothetical protein
MVSDPAHNWVFVFPFFAGIGLIWFALQPGPFYRRHHTPQDKATPVWKIRLVYIPLGLLLALISAWHFRLP